MFSSPKLVEIKIARREHHGEQGEEAARMFFPTPETAGHFPKGVAWEKMLPRLGHLFAVLGDLDLAGLEHGLFCFGQSACFLADQT